MDPGYDTTDQRMIAALQRPAEPPLGLTARLEVAVRRRARAEASFTLEEKLCLGAVALIPLLSVGGGGILMLAVAGAGVVGYLQWTVLVEEG